MEDPLKELCDMADAAGLQLKVGLRQQGHVSTVERMLAAGSLWPEIGKAIGWDGEAAQKWYFTYECEVPFSSVYSPPLPKSSYSYVIVFWRDGGNRKEQWQRIRPARARCKELAEQGCLDIHLYQSICVEIEQ